MPANQNTKKIYDLYYGQNNITSEQTMSSHWKYYSDQFNVQLDKYGNPTSLNGLGFGVTTIGKGITTKLLEYLLIISYLFQIPNKIKTVALMIKAKRICERLEFDFTYDLFRQVCSLALISKYIKKLKSGHLRFLVIGDGYGFLSCLIKEVFPNASLTLVDIGKVLIFQAYYCQKAHSRSYHYVIDNLNSNTENLANYDFVFCPSENLEAIGKLDYDIAINIASFQEMNEMSINNYFHFLRRHVKSNNLLYCCNREHKSLLGGEITEFRKYPWSIHDKHLIDGPCPWHKYTFILSRTNKGPKVFGIKVPLINYFDGKILHRLSILHKE